MRRGATSTQTFTLPFVLTSPKAVQITYSQFKYLVLVKELPDLTITVSNNKTNVVLTLSQEETFKFYPGYANVQMRIVFSDDQVFSSDIASFSVENTNNNEVIPHA